MTGGRALGYSSRPCSAEFPAGIFPKDFHALGRKSRFWTAASATAGGFPLELRIGFLKNPAFNVRPVFDLIEKCFIDLKRGLLWGCEIPAPPRAFSTSTAGPPEHGRNLAGNTPRACWRFDNEV